MVGDTLGGTESLEQHCTNCRRAHIKQMLGSFGALAMNAMLHSDRAFAVEPDATQNKSRGNYTPQNAQKAKAVIYLYMEGGPSQVDTFDFKPLLQKMNGEPLPFEKPATVFNSSSTLMASPFSFKRYGESGSWVSSLLPNLAEHVDDMTFIHSMHHEISNHSAGCFMSHTGDPIAGRPSIGSWITYALGSENQNLPGFVVLDCGQAPSGGAYTWSSGFLPASYSGVKFLKGKVAVEYLQRQEKTQRIQDLKLSAIRRLTGYTRQGNMTEVTEETSVGQEHLDNLLLNYEKAGRMQASVPELLDTSKETEHIQNLYGLDDPKTSVFGSRCLIARRLIERGVRFIEIFSPRVTADRWDQHGKLKEGHINNCRAVDRPIAGLLADLKQRGLLDETIVLWGGEFGRTPTSQGGSGRDHNPFGYTVFTAGGGFKPGYHHGSTDVVGYYATENKVHLHDLHATILHQLGIDHEQLTYRYAGRDYRLTDVYGRVVEQVVS